MEAEKNLRMSVLHVDRDADLPLMYEYLPDERAFQTVGYVRLRGVMVPRLLHAGADTDEGRDRFLLEVLISLAVPSHEARRIVRRADHVSGRGSRAEPLPRDAGSPWDMRYEQREGLHMSRPGLLIGLACGLPAGWLYAGWNGAVIGGFLGMFGFPGVFVAGWQLARASVLPTYVDLRDALARLVIGVVTITCGVLGALLGAPGFGQARGLFLGMALAALVLGLAATAFLRASFRMRVPDWLTPLIVGACAWGTYSLWSNPVSLALGIVLGIVAGSVPAAWASSSADGRW